MNCERCRGERKLMLASGTIRQLPTGQWLEQPDYTPCPDCGGTGIAYCCEGAQRFGNLDDVDPEE